MTTVRKSVADNLPGFFRQRIAGSLFESIGSVGDEAVETQVLGLQQGDPLRCDEPALAYLARDRGLRRYPTESVASHRLRLAGWRDTRRRWGSLYAQITQLQKWFSPQRPVIRAVHQQGDGACSSWHTIDDHGIYSVHKATPSNWDWDSVIGGIHATAKWSRYWIIIYTNGLDASQLIDTSLWDGGDTYNSHAIWDGVFTAAQYSDMVSVCTDSKAAHSILWGLIITADATHFDPEGSGAGYPDGTWGLVTDPVTGTPNRPNDMIFAYDLGQG